MEDVRSSADNPFFQLFLVSSVWQWIHVLSTVTERGRKYLNYKPSLEILTRSRIFVQILVRNIMYRFNRDAHSTNNLTHFLSSRIHHQLIDFIICYGNNAPSTVHRMLSVTCAHTVLMEESNSSLSLSRFCLVSSGDSTFMK